MPASKSHWLSGLPYSTARIIGFMIFGLLIFIFGAREFYSATIADKLIHVDAAAYQSTNPPDAAYVSVTGQALEDKIVAVKTDNYTAYYVPLVSADWDSSKPVGLVIENSDTRIGMRIGGWEGMLGFSDLPSNVQAKFQELHITLAPRCRILNLGENPQSRLEEAHFMLILGGAITLLGPLLFVLFSRISGPPRVSQNLLAISGSDSSPIAFTPETIQYYLFYFTQTTHLTMGCQVL